MKNQPSTLHSLAIALATAATTTYALNNGLGRTPVLGWSSWNAFADSALLNESAVMAQADAIIAHGLDKLGCVD